MNYRTTIAGATETRDGLIQHIRLTSADGSVVITQAPVKVYPTMKGDDYPEAKKRDGRLVYALPGGGEYVL